MDMRVEQMREWLDSRRKRVFPAAIESTIKSKSNSEIITSDYIHGVRVMYYIRENGKRFIIRPNVLHEWGISKTDLEQVAWENFNNLEIQMINIDHLVGDYSSTKPKLLAITNEEYNGGLYLLNPSKLKSIEDIFGGKFWLIPSSTQEVIVTPYNIIPANNIRNTIHEVNETIVIDDGIYLSNELYEYNRGVIYNVRG